MLDSWLIGSREICRFWKYNFQTHNTECLFGLSIALRWMPQDLTNEKSTLVQVTVWCSRQQAITWANVDPNLCRHMAYGVKPQGIKLSDFFSIVLFTLLKKIWIFYTPPLPHQIHFNQLQKVCCMLTFHNNSKISYPRPLCCQPNVVGLAMKCHSITSIEIINPYYFTR